MAQKVYNKLIRDRIPEIIASSNRLFEVATMTPTEFEAALREKLIEEAVEVKEADAAHLLTELADVQEIVQTLIRLHGLTFEALQQEQEKRRQERGGFDLQLKLLWTE